MAWQAPTVRPMAIKDAKESIPSAVEAAGGKRAVLVQLLHAAVLAGLGHPCRLAAHAIVLCRALAASSPAWCPSSVQAALSLTQQLGVSCGHSLCMGWRAWLRTLIPSINLRFVYPRGHRVQEVQSVYIKMSSAVCLPVPSMGSARYDVVHERDFPSNGCSSAGSFAARGHPTHLAMKVCGLLRLIGNTAGGVQVGQSTLVCLRAVIE